MKFLKNTLTIIALLTIGSVAAKGLTKTGTTSTTATRPQTGQQMEQSQPKTQQKPQQQPTKGKNFAQLFQEVKNAKNVWDSQNQVLNQTFVDRLMNDAVAANLTKKNLDILLIMARDYHAQFTGHKKDADILYALVDQRNAAEFAFELAQGLDINSSREL